MTWDSLIHLAGLYRSGSRDKITFLAIINSYTSQTMDLNISLLSFIHDAKLRNRYLIHTCHMNNNYFSIENKIKVSSTHDQINYAVCGLSILPNLAINNDRVLM